MIDPLSDAAFDDLDAVSGDADKALRVRFFVEPLKDEILSSGGEVSARDPRVAIAKEKGIDVEPAETKGYVKIVGAGRPIYRPTEMCEIRCPGDKDNVIVGRVTKMEPDPRQRFASQYAKFKRGDQFQEVGTLLRKWGVIEEAEALSYEALNIFTVEQLASMSDATCQQYRGSLSDRQRARDWIETTKGNAPIAAARAEIEKLRSEIQALREMRNEEPSKNRKAKDS